MAKKSTKTAHVLNLISKSAPEPQEPAAAVEEQSSKSEQPAASPIQNSLTQNSQNDAISNQIKDSLMQELGLSAQKFQDVEPAEAPTDTPVDALTTNVPEPAPLDAPVTEDVPEPASVNIPEQPAASEAKPEQENTDTSPEAQLAESLTEELTTEINQSAVVQSVPHTTPLQDVLTDFSAGSASTNMNINDTPMATVHTTHTMDTASTAAPTTNTLNTVAAPATISSKNNAASPNQTKRFHYINICEELVKEKLLEYMNRFNVCTCDRCVVDTMALALTNLPSKYVVMDTHMQAPFLNFCSSKYGVEVMTELTKACLVVAAHPRHTQEDLDAKKD